MSVSWSKRGTLAALAVLACGLAVMARAETVELKVSHYLPESHGIHRDFIAPWARELEERTDGKVKVTVYPGTSSFGNITRQLDQVRAGVVDAALGLSGLPRGRFPATSVIELPFLVETADAGTRTLWDLYNEGYLGDEYRGLEVLALFTHNAGLFHTSERPVREIADLKGLRMRTPSVPISQMVEYLGGTPVGMPPSQVYENLQKGTLDGVVFTWDAVGAFRLNEVLRYHTDARAYVVSFYFVMNERKYEALPADVRGAIDAVSGDALLPKFGSWWDKWDAAGRRDAVERDHEIIPVDDAQRAQWRERLQPMIRNRLDELEKEGVANARAIYQRAQELVDQYQN